MTQSLIEDFGDIAARLKQLESDSHSLQYAQNLGGGLVTVPGLGGSPPDKPHLQLAVFRSEQRQEPLRRYTPVWGRIYTP